MTRPTGRARLLLLQFLVPAKRGPPRLRIEVFMPGTLQLANPPPLTTLTEDEILFRDNVRQFAEDKIRPLAKEMDEKRMFDHALIDQFFQLGLMGIEIR